MIELLQLILHIVASLFKSRAKLEAEILVLRQQLNVLRRQVSKRPQRTAQARLHARSVDGRAVHVSRPAVPGIERGSGHTGALADREFVLPTITFRLLDCFVILRHGRRLWVSFGVTTNPTAEWISRQITEAFPWDSAPRYLIRDRDTAYGPVFVQRLRAMGIRDKPTAPRSPWQNPYVERLIGTIRRECLDHMIVFGQAHLRRNLGKFAAYYNESRIHRSLDKDAPFHRAIERVGAITSQPVLGGLHHQYCRI
jgi:transposase InsO family protein